MVGTRGRNGVDMESVRIEYIHTAISIPDLATKYGLSYDALRKRAERGKWVVERIAAEQKAVAAAAEAASKQRVSDLISFNSDDLKVARAIRAKVAKRITAAGENMIPTAELRQLATAAEAAQRIGRLALGASTDNMGHAGQDGQGPIEHADVSKEVYLEARNAVIQDF